MTRPVMMVTGASAGIGAATAVMAAARGYDVVVNYRRDREGAEAVAAQVETAGARALIVQADVADPAAVARLFAEADAGFGRLDVLVNNAGIVGPALRIEEMEPARIQEMFAINVFGTVYCAQEAVRRMARRHGGGGGVIVNLSSVAAELGAPGQYADYAAAKAAVDTLTKSLALENARDGIRVAAVRPGIIETEIHAKGGDAGRAARLGPEVVPMGRAGTAEEIAEAVLWLASDAARYVTGEVVKVSGGR
ncbi:MAG: SDR family oxidoreductase [Pseudomonadota bacterium]